MNIHELERLTDISKQNIRFYEKRGLLHPERNELNNYRQYTQEDVKTLLIIKMLRKLDMPIEDIRKIFSGEEALSGAIEERLGFLLEKRREINACIDVCRSLRGTELEVLDAEQVLRRMDEIERTGGVFMSIINDYKKMAEAEAKRSFTFPADARVDTPEVFTEVLFRYADMAGLNMVITKEGMIPFFEIDGTEYRAECVRGPLGTVVRCSMTHPEELEIENISVKRKWLYRFWHEIMWFIPALLCLGVITRSIPAVMVTGIWYVLYAWWNSREKSMNPV